MKPKRLANGQMIPRKRRRGWRGYVTRYTRIDKDYLIEKMRAAMKFTTLK